MGVHNLIIENKCTKFDQNTLNCLAYKLLTKCDSRTYGVTEQQQYFYIPLQYMA